MQFEWDEAQSERNRIERNLPFRLVVEDDSMLTDEDLANIRPVYPAPTPDDIRALRAQLSLSQKQFADRFGFTVDAIQQYEQGRRRPSGPAATLLRVVAAEPDAVARALDLLRRRFIRDEASQDESR